MERSDLAQERLGNAVGWLAARPWLCAMDPGRDFTRSRKIPLGKLLLTMVTWDSHSIETELLDGHGWDGGAPSVSAFCQQRAKLNDRAMPLLSEAFLRQWDVVPFLGRWRLMAADGTGVPVPMSADESTRIRNGNGPNTHCELHPTLAYDLMRGTFEDMVVQGAAKSNEPAALCQIVDRLWPGRAPDGTRLQALWLADRNYCTFNVLCHMVEAGASFCIRANDERAAGILGMKSLPEAGIDRRVELTLTRTRSEAHRRHPDEPQRYRRVKKPVPLDVVRDRTFGEYDMELRVVRVAVESKGGTSWVNLVTNLGEDEFSPEALSDLYSRRWAIELGIRELKHVVGMRDPRSRDTRLVAMEMWGRVVLHNVCSLGSGNVPRPRRGRKHRRSANRAAAFRGMKRKVRGDMVMLERAVARLSHSVRPGRLAPRRERSQRPPRFTYNG